MRRFNFTQQKISSYLLTAQKWYLETPQRALDEAYQAALSIKALEDEHFNGKKIAPESIAHESVNYGDSVMAFFQGKLKKHLKTIRMRLTEFRISHSFLNDYDQKLVELSKKDGESSAKDSFAVHVRNSTELAMEKLSYIDGIIAKYTTEDTGQYLLGSSRETVANEPRLNEDTLKHVPPPKLTTEQMSVEKSDSKAEKIGSLPKFGFSSLNHRPVELDPQAEPRARQNFRAPQKRTLISTNLIILLILVPFLALISKNLIIDPLVAHFRTSQEENQVPSTLQNPE